MHILIVGTGYVGLVTGACLAEMGHFVTCLDIDEHKIQQLQTNQIPIFEPGLTELVQRNQAQHRLRFTTHYASALQGTQVAFLAVPTPSQEDGSCNTTYIAEAARQIARHMGHPLIIANKSTAPVGTVSFIRKTIQDELAQRKIVVPFDVVSNPEFLKEGAAVQDCLKPDRIIIGSDRPESAELLREVYAPFTLSHDRILVMDTRSAEMTKYAANAMLATRISFMNEIAEICKTVGANVNEVRKGIGADSRIGYHFLYPGIGYGGSCFPKDIRALIAKARSCGISPLLLEAVDQINDRQKKVLSRSLLSYFSPFGGVQDKVIAVWGLSFKPDTDDMREAPSLVFIQELLQQGACLRLFDPVAMANAAKLLPSHPRLIWCQDEFDAAHGADAIALLTEWKQFRLVDFTLIRKQMRGCAFFDGRNQYKPTDMKRRGFDYISIGVPDQLQIHSSTTLAFSTG